MTTNGRERARAQIKSAVEAGRPVVLRGSMGVGKTFLLSETLAVLRKDGWTCTTINANVATSTIPFGPLAEFAPDDEVSNQPALLRSIADTLQSLGSGQRHLIAIDDAPLLDDQSVAVFHQLLADSSIQVIATARSTDPESTALTGLWHDTDAEHVEVQPLDKPAATALVEAQLGLNAEPATVAQIVQRADGNPLFLVELARASTDSDSEGLTRCCSLSTTALRLRRIRTADVLGRRKRRVHR